MWRFRTIMLGVLGVLSASCALLPAVAIAEPTVLETEVCEVKTEEVAVLCIVPSGQKTLWAQLQTGEWAFDSEIQKGTTALLASPSSEASVPAVSCSSANDTTSLDTTAVATLSLALLKLLVLLTSCLVTNSSEAEEACEAGEPLEVHGEGEIEAGNNVAFKQEGTLSLAEIAIKSKTGKTCPVALVGTKKLTGSQRCYFNSDEELQESAKAHLLICPGEGSALLLAEQEYDLSLEEMLSLNKGGEWALKGGPIELTNGARNYQQLMLGLTRNRTFTFRNTVAVEYTGLNLKRLTGATNGYKEVTNGCKGLKAANATCTIEVQFAPLAAEDYVSVLELFWEAGGVHAIRNLVVLGMGTA